ncbi:MAG: DNA-directed RNA polymerase subunit alpha [Mycoplasmatales bacterium]
MENKYNFDIVFPKIKVIDDARDMFHKTFEIEPLESGFGITVGNALRRIALSTLPGGAVTKINIKDIAHEFARIDNAVEDITTIVLSVKDLKVRIDDSQDEEYKLILRGNKQGELLAGDIECPPGVEVINKELKIVTLSSSTPFEMELTVTKGRGYVPAEENRGKEKKSGEIYVDSIFTPISKFTYSVSDTRVGDKTNYDKLTVDIWTNGMVTPEEALSYSAFIMQSHMGLLVDIEDSIRRTQVFEEQKIETIVAPVSEDSEETSIETLDISNRAYNGLKRANINTIEDLCSRSKREISSLDNIGAKTVDEIENQLKEQGMSFRED